MATNYGLAIVDANGTAVSFQGSRQDVERFVGAMGGSIGPDLRFSGVRPVMSPRGVNLGIVGPSSMGGEWMFTMLVR